MKELVLATGNRHKVEEIRAILRKLPIKIIPAYELGDIPEVVEDGDTLEENAVKKARTIALLLKKWTLADDTGLEVDQLNGEPGVYSARWAGPGCSYADNNRKLLARLKGVPPAGRSARFRCVIAVSSPRGKVRTVDGEIRGAIAGRARGRNGFGYDPLFLVPGHDQTFSELSAEIKNRISHRARALRKAAALVRSLISAAKPGGSRGKTR